MHSLKAHLSKMESRTGLTCLMVGMQRSQNTRVSGETETVQRSSPRPYTPVIGSRERGGKSQAKLAVAEMHSKVLLAATSTTGSLMFAACCPQRKEIHNLNNTICRGSFSICYRTLSASACQMPNVARRGEKEGCP